MRAANIGLFTFTALDRLARTPGIDPAAFDQASHDEAWGCAYSRVWRAYQEGIRQAG